MIPKVLATVGSRSGGISVGVTLAVLGAAVLHAVWNALAKSVKDQLVGFMALELAAGAVALGAVPFLPAPAVGAWPYLVASLGLHTGYQAFLLNSYRVGEFNQVYPIARGTAPLVVAVVAIPAAGERLQPVQLVGLAAVAGGLFSLASLRTWWADGRPPALAFAVATGLLIATYSVVDGLGVRHSGSPLGYAAWLMAAEALPVPLYALARQPERVRASWSATWPRAGLGGLLSLIAYSIVLWAQTRGALGAVAALRETGVLVAAVIGSLLFGEAFGRTRTIAAAAVAGGVVLLNLH
jgi:drug/metabolite transporter (DMT)-like permease